MALQRATDSRPVVGDCILDGVGGRRCCDAFRVVKLDEIASGADLGVVATIQLRLLKTEVEKVSM